MNNPMSADTVAYLVARVSDKDQDSNEAQINRLRTYSQSLGFVNVIEREIRESSSTADRKKFQEIIGEIRKSKKPCALIVDTVDRLQRSFRESVMLDEMRKEGKVELYFYRENLRIHRASNSADMIRWDMAVMFARSYVLQLSDNVKRKFEQMRKNGDWMSKAPFGYNSIVKDAEKRLRSDLVLNPREAGYVKQIFEMYASGHHSLNSICEWLKKEKVTTKTGIPYHSSALHHMLCNPFYHGEMKSRYGIFRHRYRTIIDKTLYLKVQRLLDQKNNNPIKIKGAKRFIFGGFLTCAHCGCTISAQVKKGRYVYYNCTDGKGICTKTYLNEGRFLEAFRKTLDEIRLSEEQIEQVCVYLKAHHGDQTLFQQNAIKKLQTEYARCQENMDRMLDLLIENKIPQTVYDSKLQEFTNRQVEIDAELKDLTLDSKSHHITARTILLLAKYSSEIFESSEMEQKREILMLLLQNSKLVGVEPVFGLKEPFNTIREFVRLSTTQNTAESYVSSGVSRQLINKFSLEHLDVQDESRTSEMPPEKSRPEDFTLTSRPLLPGQDSNLRPIDYTYSYVTVWRGLYHHRLYFYTDGARRFECIFMHPTPRRDSLWTFN